VRARRTVRARALYVVRLLAVVAATALAAGNLDASEPAEIAAAKILAPCGENIVYLLARIADVPVRLEDVRARLNRCDEDLGGTGHRVSSLADVLGGLGVDVEPIEVTFAELRKLGTPSIVYLHSRKAGGVGHFVVVWTDRNGRLRIADPPNPVAFVPEPFPEDRVVCLALGPTRDPLRYPASLGGAALLGLTFALIVGTLRRRRRTVA